MRRANAQLLPYVCRALAADVGQLGGHSADFFPVHAQADERDLLDVFGRESVLICYCADFTVRDPALLTLHKVTPLILVPMMLH